MLEVIKSSVLKSKNISPFLVPSEHHNGQAAESGGLTSENDSALSKDENYQFDENMQVFKS